MNTRIACLPGLLLTVCIGYGPYSHASVIGTNPPAGSLTQARIAQLPAAAQAAWAAYLGRSERQRNADKDALRNELKLAGLNKPSEPPHGNSARSIPLDRDPVWYASPEAKRIANVIVSFQTPAGGWSKNIDMSSEARKPGEAFATNNLSRFLTPGDFDTPLEPDWNYVGTIDNDATITQLRFLAKVVGTAGERESAPWSAAFLRGLDYLFDAQFPNGGWPQVWPLEGGYHDAITFNDDAMTQVVELMSLVAQGGQEFAFVPPSVREKAQASFERGIKCILAAQIVTNGTATVWPQQADALTLKPVSGRNFEPPAASGAESAAILLLLMNRLPHPTAAEQRAIHSATAWLRKTAIYGQSWERAGDVRALVPKPGAGPIWARYYEIGTDKPIFADRDKTIHDSVGELSKERRNGYAWYGAGARSALERFEQWSRDHPPPGRR